MFKLQAGNQKKGKIDPLRFNKKKMKKSDLALAFSDDLG